MIVFFGDFGALVFFVGYDYAGGFRLYSVIGKYLQKQRASSGVRGEEVPVPLEVLKSQGSRPVVLVSRVGGTLTLGVSAQRTGKPYIY